jgi:hypothetical protein
MYPLTRSTSRSRFFGLPFSPASLFAAGEQGFWYDPSDYSTLFQDSAGATPVTAVEQAVGLMLDKSKGLVLGSELVTPAANRDFSSDTGYWSKTAGVTITGGQCVFTAVTSLNGLYRNAFVSAGVYYEVTFTISSLTAGNCQWYFGGNRGSVVTAAGTYTQRIRAGSVDAALFFEAVNGPSSLTLDDVSIKQVTGNHAFQTTSAKRPVLRARYNLLTYSEQFDNGVWTAVTANVSVTPNTTVAPDGTTTADSLVFSAGGYLYQQQTVGSVAGKTFTFSCWLWTLSGTAKVVLRLYDSSTTTINNTICDLTTTPTRFTLTQAFISPDTQLFFGIDRRSAGVGGDGLAGTVIGWGAQLIFTNSLLSNNYQRIAAATNYDTTGFLPYLQFDGVDDAMTTNSIDFSATDKMTLFAGVRKLSDAATGMLLESSPGASSNDGAFLLDAPDTVSNRYGWGVRGTVFSSIVTTSASYTAPITNVVTATGNISAPNVTLQINGVVAATSAASQGTGNFGNYPLFIGQRNQTSFPFNGWLTSLIGRGAVTSAGQISATETWVNGKTGAY